MQARIQNDLQAYINSDTCDSSLLYTYCTILAQLLENKPDTNLIEQDRFVVTIDQSVPDNLFQSLNAFTFQTTTLDRLPNPDYHLFLTLVANVVRYNEMKNTQITNNVITQYVFEGRPKLSLLTRNTVLELCYALGTNTAKRPEDLQDAAAHLLPFLERQEVERFKMVCTHFLDKPQLCFTTDALIASAGINHHFQCKLFQKKCAVPDCYTWVDIGLPYCAEHLASILHLQIKQSTIANSGLGVFAFQPDKSKRKKPVFKKNQSTGLTYQGEVLNQEQHVARYTIFDNDVTAPYTLLVKNQRKKEWNWIDGSCKRHVSVLLNHAFTDSEKQVLLNPKTAKQKERAKRNAAIVDINFTANCLFLNNGEIVATRNIHHNEELLVSYGMDYFKSSDQNTQSMSTKPCL